MQPTNESRTGNLVRRAEKVSPAKLAAAQYLIAAVLVVTTTVDDILGFLLVGIPWLSNRIWSSSSDSLSQGAPAANTP